MAVSDNDADIFVGFVERDNTVLRQFTLNTNHGTLTAKNHVVLEDVVVMVYVLKNFIFLYLQNNEVKKLDKALKTVAIYPNCYSMCRNQRRISTSMDGRHIYFRGGDRSLLSLETNTGFLSNLAFSGHEILGLDHGYLGIAERSFITKVDFQGNAATHPSWFKCESGFEMGRFRALRYFILWTS